MIAYILLPIAALSFQRPIEESRFRDLRLAISQNDVPLFSKTHDMIWQYHDRQRLLGILNNYLGHTSGAMQRKVLFGLSLFRHQAKVAISNLIAIVDSANKTPDTDCIPVVSGTLSDLRKKNKNAKELPNSRNAAECLGWIGPAAVAAIPSLKTCLSSGDVYLVCAACVALWRIERRPETIAPTLNAYLTSRWAYKQMEALSALADIGDGIKEQVGPTLLKLTKAEDPILRTEALKLVITFAPDHATAAEILAKSLVHCLDEDARLARQIARKQIALQVGALNYNLLRRERMTIINALVSLQSLAVPVLVDLLRPKYDTGTRCCALEVLAALGKQASTAIAAVQILTADPDPLLRGQAEKTLRAIYASRKYGISLLSSKR
jgi:hypothetical protein